jgi:uncharacterized protein (TIGR02246 family)
MNQTNQTKILDRLVEAYNSSDARAFADLFDETAVIYEHPNQPAQQSRREIFEFYEKLFAQFPENRTEVLHRIVLENRIADHERVRRSFDVEPFEVVTIYEMEGSLIKRVDFIRS